MFFQRSHSSFHSFTPFQHTGVGERFVVHLIEQLFLLFVVQLSHQSSQSSQLSIMPFQHIDFVVLHSKEHFQSYQLLVQLSHCSHISLIQFQHFTIHLSAKSTGQVMHVSQISTTQLPQLGFEAMYLVHINVH
ncbi:hypothetical protein IJ913_00370 [bacterium]|nr:hypothetical protein [bacterium]